MVWSVLEHNNTASTINHLTREPCQYSNSSIVIEIFKFSSSLTMTNTKHTFNTFNTHAHFFDILVQYGLLFMRHFKGVEKYRVRQRKSYTPISVRVKETDACTKRMLNETATVISRRFHELITPNIKLLRRLFFVHIFFC